MLPVFPNILMMYMCMFAVLCLFVVTYYNIYHHTYLDILGLGILTQKFVHKRTNTGGIQGDLSDFSISVGDPWRLPIITFITSLPVLYLLMVVLKAMCGYLV
jgi:hypothetical protein